MKDSTHNMGRMLFLLLIIGFGLFTPLFHAVVNRVPSVTPEEVRLALAQEPGKNLLVDVCSEDVYPRLQLPDATKEPCVGNLDRELLKSKKRVFVICNTGLISSWTVRRLRRQGVTNAYSVRGGLEAWFSGETRSCRAVASPQAGAVEGPIRRIAFTWLEQGMICFASFGLKPLYELMALFLAWVIWKRPESHWRILRWGLLAFFVGENACAINYLFYGLENFTWEFWHCYGMLIAFGFVSYALVDFIDHEMIHYSQRETPCAFLKLCKSCYKHQPVACHLWIIFLFTIPALVILSLMPLCASFQNFMSRGPVFGTEVLFTHSVLQQMYEIRIYPLVAILLFAVAWVILFRGKEDGLTSSKWFFSAGLGAMGFSLMRFLLYWAFSDSLLWAEAWEEVTEFLFILSIVVLLCVKAINRRMSS